MATRRWRSKPSCDRLPCKPLRCLIERVNVTKRAASTHRSKNLEGERRDREPGTRAALCGNVGNAQRTAWTGDHRD